MNKPKRAFVWIIAAFLLAGVLADTAGARKGSKVPEDAIGVTVELNP